MSKPRSKVTFEPTKINFLLEICKLFAPGQYANGEKFATAEGKTETAAAVPVPAATTTEPEAKASS